MFLVSSCSCLRSIHWSQVLSWEWRCSWSSAGRWCSNYIWVINNCIAYKGATYIRGFTVLNHALSSTAAVFQPSLKLRRGRVITHITVKSITSMTTTKSRVKYRSRRNIQTPRLWYCPQRATNTKTCHYRDGSMILKRLADDFEWEIVGTRNFSLRGTSDPRSWYEALVECKKGGAILASIHSEDEMNALIQFVRGRLVKLWSWFYRGGWDPMSCSKGLFHSILHTHSVYNTHTVFFCISMWPSYISFEVRSWMSYYMKISVVWKHFLMNLHIKFASWRLRSYANGLWFNSFFRPPKEISKLLTSGP